MKITDFFVGRYDNKFWKRLCLILIAEFLGTLLIAWALRPIWLEASWKYVPFTQYISTLGAGRLEGNIGAWIFLIGFCLFPIIGTAWNFYLFQQFKKVSKTFAFILWIVFEFSLINVAFVGIFDGLWPNPELSGFMHWFGATFSFLGHVVSATLVFLGITIIYLRTPKINRTMKHPFYFSLVIVELIGVYLLFRTFGGPTWQWLIMLSLNIFLLASSLLFPEDIKQGEQ
ncbi:hypothetical protein DSAG12_01550 [Promethearchaeum syntrophicum]|uniref:Uncharacterized protein n=1 Tax=Promethearchaeum syntrophicum TaxID=2594042 RepID=A0A5B9D9G2_9ARCH|nr:hypothetical protein [Candidatus Prometheoarchaeum syntrophicum]QEE15723.1 hypothetical protein DSAG12_01550 [Candidatus Prometheoarchaeum syntrophicum]